MYPNSSEIHEKYIPQLHDYWVFILAVVDCGSLSNPRFGSVDLTGTDFGSTATYSCQKGYVLSGKSTRTCQANGQWSGVAPVCRSESVCCYGTAHGALFALVAWLGQKLANSSFSLLFSPPT